MVAKTNFLRAILALALLFAGQALAQDELRATFFKDADAAKAAAEAADASLLAPRAWERGMSEYEDAEDLLRRGRNIEYVRDNAADATRYFREAEEKAKLARTKFAQVLKSRQDAANARAKDLAPELWEQAQRKFGEAIRYLERGDLKGASRRDIEATGLYRDAELMAIKEEYLAETRRLLANADRARVGRYAPITLGNAKSLLANAERELNENRYDTDLPRSLARQANYEAKHALYLSEVVRKVRDRDLTAEQLVLQWEASLRDIAGVADIVPDMETGPDTLTAELVSYFENLQNELQALRQDKAENEVRIADMEDELRALDERLGGATAERAALIQRLEAQERVKEQFVRVEKMFTSDEARVFREGNNVILRLVGLSFDSGASQIRPENFDLLAKVEKAIDVFPRSELIIEGHTDSHGGDELNQELSQERAESVMQYMINAMRIPTYRLIATGYGETRPVASNETESGRARNRRIDIVIKPNFEANGS
ncbi:MAG: OmpA family protein [Gammaproteobacteria bacterium]|nr:OmpA family protein [Gammaproteobacteria bacterium]NNF49543.1 OmpA family protein [Woeseiaceae bacterium]MBT8093837.1 OmpA family protein [Gammaproteobacteria bacterium]MBT8105820.1 OmpA family protein [Gammaproteobacteria bacterium]NNK25834.1 OmpA family protein [Woeseiaceae bacterium]